MGEEVTTLALSLVAGFAISLVYCSMRRNLSPAMAAIAAVIVIVGAPISLSFGRSAPVVSAVWGLLVALLTDAVAAHTCKKRRGGKVAKG